MWDCKYRRSNDYCYRRRTRCYPGGIKCVLRGKFWFPLRNDQDPLENTCRGKRRRSRR